MMKFSKKFESEEIDKIQKYPKQEMERENPWYTDDQFEAAEKNVKPTIQRRYHFIFDSIGKYLQSYNKKPLRVLDAGCGDGVQLKGIIKIPELEIWGIDYNPIRTGRAGERFPTVNIVCGDLLDIPFKKKAFDIVLCSQVIEHIPQDDFLLEELAKVVKPEGLLILGTPNEGCFMARLRNHIFARRILKSTDHLHFYKESIIRRKIEGAGFIIQEVMRENWFFPHQRINYYLTNRNWGFRFMAQLNKIIPSQAAGYYFRCVKVQ
jgi:2-polyprenyl-3-methyl-5-hydroxy-6-metoxy-1,4-benzoquinol methylase